MPLLKTSIVTPTAIAKIESILEDNLAERTVIHAVLLDVLGLGILITGESGIGKSECALDLIVRGHRLVADDTVEVRRRAETILIGTCPDLTRHHMELRGLGVINIKELFGIASTRSSKRVELVVQLERWDPLRQYERLGLDDEHYEILGLRVPLIRMPVAPGRNIAILVEVAARNQLLRARGHHAARMLAARLEDTPSSGCGGRGVERSVGGRRRGGHRRRRPSVTRRRKQTFAGSHRQAHAPLLHHPHGSVGIGKIAGGPRARGSRLLLRRQPADDADSDACDAGASRRRHREGGHRRRCPRAKPARVVPARSSAAFAG